MSGSINIPVISKFDATGIKQAQSALGGFGKSLLSVGALVAGAFAVRGIVNFAKESVIAAERAQQFNDILIQVAKTTGVFGSNVNAATDRMIKFADSHELVIGVEAELIKETQAVLLSFKAVGVSANQAGGNFDRATKAAFDMAAVLKTDARSSAVQLGKALEDPIKGVTALAKAGTTFTAQQREQIRALVESGQKLEAQNLILTEVESQYGGAAEAAALGSQKMVLAFGQIQDALGAALAPAFEKFTAYFINEVVPPLTKFFEDDFPTMISNFGDTFDALAPAFERVRDVLRDAFDISEENTLLEGLLINIEKLGRNQMFIGFLEDIVEGFARMLPDLIELVPLMLQLAEQVVPLLLMLLPPLISFVGFLSEVFGDVSVAIQDATRDTGDWMENTKNIVGLILESLPVVGSWVRIFNDIADAVAKASDAMQRWLGISGGQKVTGPQIAPPPAPARTPPSRTPVRTPAPIMDARFQRTRAEGGRVTGGFSYLVGEMGPEIFQPGRGGNIVPNDQMGRGGGANITINVNAGMGTNGAQVGEQIVAAIKRYERTSGPVFASA